LGMFDVVGSLILVAVGGALGGCARYLISGVIARHLGETFPWGTMTINVTGAFVIGLFGALATHPGSLFASPNGSSNTWLFAVTGFLGCYTTVSSFSLQTLMLANNGEKRLAIGNVVLSVSLCLTAVASGFFLADRWG